LALQYLQLVPQLKLIAPTPDRFARLVTQLKWRLLEGGGQAIYEIGVADSGQLVGLTQGELEESLETLERMADELGATMLISRAIEVPVLRGRIEGAGRVRAIQSPTPAALPAGESASKALAIKKHEKYNHTIGREWEGTALPSVLGEKIAVGSGSRKDKKLAIKMRKRETLAGSNSNPRGVAKVPGAIQRSPLSDNVALPEEESSSSGSDSASTASTASAARSTSVLGMSAASSAPVEAFMPIRIPRQISQSRGDPLLKAMAKRMKRDAARERGKGLLSTAQTAGGTVASLAAESATGRSVVEKDLARRAFVDTGLAVPAMPLPPVEMALRGNGGSNNVAHEEQQEDDERIPSDQEGDEDDAEDDERELTRWIVEVQVLRKMDADAGEGFLDFEGFGME